VKFRILSNNKWCYNLLRIFSFIIKKTFINGVFNLWKKDKVFKSFIYILLTTFILVGCNNQIIPIDPAKLKKVDSQSNKEEIEQATKVVNEKVSSNKNNSNIEQAEEEDNQEYVNKEETPENNGIFGTWYIWIPGSATNYYDEETSEYATHEFTPGAEAGQIMLFENGSYSMVYSLWEDRIVRGKWYLSESGEINGEPGEAIILMGGPGGTDWAIAPAQDGTLRLLQYSGTWNDGSSMWQFDSELYR